MDSPKNPFQAEEPAPEKLGKYVVERELGRGGMGVVYLCRDPDLDRLVAIKVLPESVQSDSERLRRFREEAKNLARLVHPNIASIYSIERSDTGAWLLVMEFVDGKNLSRAIKSHRLSVEECLRVCLQLARGIAAAHAQGIWHRDIKPGNIMLMAGHKVKVLDFGLAKRERGLASSGVSPDDDVTATFATNPGQIIGTPGYMSPEQIYGKGVDHRTDIFSFGAVLFVCLTGEHAFSGETTMHVITNTCHVDPDWDRIPDNVPQRVRELVRQCLAKDKEDRLGDINVAIEELESAIAEYSSGSIGGGVQNVAAAPDRRFEYELVRVLSVGEARLEVVRRLTETGERVDDNRTFCRKLIEPNVQLLGAGRAADACRAFLESARIQQTAAEADPGSWAPIHDYGGTDRSASEFGSPSSGVPASLQAFYITDEYKGSLAQIIGRDVNSAQLRRIVTQIIGALLVMKHSLGREHGRLKPTNVLLSDENISRARIVLTDPASGSQDRASGASRSAASLPDNRALKNRDLRALGQIIYQLVEQRMPRDQGAIHVADSPAWRRLGRHGGIWRELCASLLNASGSDTLQAVQAKLAAMRRPTVSRGTWAALAATVVLVGAAAAFVTTLFDDNERPTIASPVDPPATSEGPAEADESPAWWDRYAEQRGLWSESLRSEDDWALLASLVTFDCLRDVRSHLAQLDLSRRNLPEVDAVMAFGAAESEQVQVTMALLEGLAPAIGSCVEDVGMLATVWQQRGWVGPAQQLEQSADEIDAALTATGGDRSALLPNTQALLISYAKGQLIEARWSSLGRGDLRTIATIAGDAPEGLPPDPVLAAFEDVTRERIASISTLAELESALQQCESASNRMAQRLSERWRDIEHSELRETEFYRQFRAELADVDDFDEWWTLASQLKYQRPRETEFKRAVADAHSELLSMLSGITTWRSDFERACQEPAAEADQLLEGIRASLDRPRQRSQAALRDLRQEVDEHRAVRDQFVDLIRRDIVSCGAGCEVALNDLLPCKWQHDTTCESWNQFVEQTEAVECRERLALLSTAERFLSESEQFRASDALPIMLRPLIKPRRDGLLDNVIRRISLSSVPAEAGAFWTALPERETLKEWEEALEDGLNRFDRVRSRLDEAYLLNEAWPDNRSVNSVRSALRRDVAETLSELPEVQEIESRIEAMEELNDVSDVEALVSLVEASQHPELRRAAWQRMGALVPGHREALDYDRRARTSLTLTYAGLSAARQKSLEQELLNESRARWIEHVKRIPADEVAWFETVAATAEEFSISPAIVATLPPKHQFNLLLASQKRALRRPEPGQDVAALGRELVAWLGDARTPEKFDGAGRLRAELAELLREIEQSQQRADGMAVTDVGPAALASMKWEAELQQDAFGRFIVFTPPTQWSRSHPLVFREIEDDAAGPQTAWLCTTEVAAGVFIDAIAHLADSRTRSEIRSAMDTHRTRGVSRLDVRIGPRVWDWTGNDMAVRETWLSFELPVNGEPILRKDGRGEFVVHEYLADGSYVNASPGKPLLSTYIHATSPSIAHPMQHVSVAAAERVAQLLHCRLPTVSEWRSAAAVSSQDDGPRNVRDRTWLDHQKRWKAVRAVQVKGEVRDSSGVRPFEGAISSADPLGFGHEYPADRTPSNGAFVQNTEEVADEAHDDDHLWFREVVDDAGTPGAAATVYRDLVGNVWEFVRADAQHDGVEGVRVVGRSALSDPDPASGDEFQLTQHVFAANADPLKATFPDVGFRLAFTAQVGENFIAKLKELILEQPYVLDGR